MDTLIKLASIGASGICIYAVFRVADLIHKLPDKTSKTQIIVINRFMVMCVVMAIISAAAGLYNSFGLSETLKINQKQLAHLESENAILNHKLGLIDGILNAKWDDEIERIRTGTLNTKIIKNRIQDIRDVIATGAIIRRAEQDAADMWLGQG